jgi:hypothetical protein
MALERVESSCPPVEAGAQGSDLIATHTPLTRLSSSAARHVRCFRCRSPVGQDTMTLVSETFV